MSLVTRTAEVLRGHGALHRGVHLLIAASGGRDSTALAHLLAELRSRWSLRLTFAYVHHGLRPEADAEADFVRTLARDCGAEFALLHIDVRGMRRREGGSVQDVARRLRYDALETLRAEIGAEAILTAHHADDQAETLLARFLRGTGVSGLAGIRARRGTVVRPLLGVSAAELAAWATERGLHWMHDASNDSDAYSRNRLRHHVIPAVRGHAGAAWPSVMHDTARLFQSLDDFLFVHIKRLSEECITEREDGIILAVQPLKGYFEFEQLALLRHAVALLRGDDGLFDEVFSLHQLLDADPGKRAVLRGGVVAFREKSQIAIVMPGSVPESRQVTPDGEWLFGGAVLQIERCSASDVRLHADPSEEYIDLDAAGDDLVLRAWSPEDTFIPLGFDAAKRVGAFLADAGWPLHRRLRVPVLAGRRGIVWVCGVRLDNRVRIGPETATPARIRYFHHD